jgi:hypothetical protein
MTSDTPHRTELLTEQLNILRRLAAEYRESFSAFTSLNLTALQGHIATLDSLGQMLGRMAITPRPLPPELAAARAEVNQLNRTFAAVARCGLRTNKVRQHLVSRLQPSTASPSFQAYV